MSASLRKSKSCADSESPVSVVTQRLDAVKQVSLKIQQVNGDLQEMKISLSEIKSSIENIKSSLVFYDLENSESKQARADICEKLEILSEKVEQNQEELVDSIESYLVSDNFTPRSNMSGIVAKLDELEAKIGSVEKNLNGFLHPPIRSASKPREAHDTEKVVFGKLKLRKEI